MKANQGIRRLMANKRLKNWEVANKIGISDSRFSVWLRTELSDERKKRVLVAIKTLSEEMQ